MTEPNTPRGEPGPPFVAVVDVETTGFERALGHMPVEIGRCDLIAARDLHGDPDWSAARVGAPIFSLVNPGRPIPPEASAVHHLVDADVAAAPRWDEGMIAIGSRCLALAAHSARMEQQWLTPEATGAVPWIDTWKCALRAWPQAPGHSNQCLRYWLNPTGLDRQVASPAHRAGPDAYVSAFLLRELLGLYSFDQLAAWSLEPAVLIRVPFGRPPSAGGARGLRWTEVDDGFLCWVAGRDFSEDILHTVKIEIARREALRREPPVDP